MILSAVVILAVVLVAYMWSTRGFLSAFLHMLCVLIAGALALAAWEPLAEAILVNSGPGMIADNAWAIALGGPFVLALIILRTATDKLVPANTDFARAIDMVGGGACGAVAGVITVGVGVLAVGYTRIGPDMGIGYRPVNYANNGSLVREGALILPADSLTTRLYSAMSAGVFHPTGSDRTLARLRPAMWEEGTLLRTNFEDGKSRSTLPPGSFEVGGYYTYAPRNPQELFSDSFQRQAQNYQYLNGDSATPADSEIIGVSVKFKAGAKEKSGRVVVGPSQVRLIVQTDPNDPASVMPVQPAAMVSQAEAATAARGRWRFDAKDPFIASVGGRDDAPMAFEFPVPKGSIPIAVYVKGSRHSFIDPATDEPVKPLRTYTSGAERDGAIRSGAILSTQSAASLDRTSTVTVKIENNAGPDNHIRVDAALPFNMVMSKDALKGLTSDGSNSIDGGSLSIFDEKDLTNRGIDLNLAVRRFASADDTTLIQMVGDSSNRRFGLLADAAAGADRGKPPVLVDENGASYSPVGFVYKDGGNTTIYYNPQAPIQSIDGDPLPSMSKSKPAQQLILIYRVSRGVKITGFAIGDRLVAEFKPALDANR